MEDQYGMVDLRQYMTPTDMFTGHRNLTQYEMGLPSSTVGGLNGLEMEVAGAGDGATGRWPRQETLTLLEIRSRLDFKFKEAIQKGPLWDELSRVMCEEHGYQRSGKKCREKFENLYKYYKKTKEGKAGRQDGKHYRFFRQLEALCGGTETSNTNTMLGNNFRQIHTPPTNNNNNNEQPFQAPKISESISITTTSEFDSSSSDGNSNTDDDDDDDNGSREKGKKRMSWKKKIREFIDEQMKRLMEKQEEWLEKMMKTIEGREEGRIRREEEWRRQEAARIEREHKFWANERAWIEARDSALLKALHKFAEGESNLQMTAELQGLSRNRINGVGQTIEDDMKGESWPECEITRLIHLRTSMASRFQQVGCSSEEVILWEDIAEKMACLGYNRSALMCRDKWDSIESFLRQAKKHKDNSRTTTTCNYFPNNDLLLYNHHQGSSYGEINEQDRSSPPPQPPSSVNSMQENCFRHLMGDGENLWENYGVKLGKRDNH